jgi:hypothetical protein
MVVSGSRTFHSASRRGIQLELGETVRQDQRTASRLMANPE